MKKMLSILLVACLCCGMLAGCSGNQEGTSGEAVKEKKTEDEKTVTANFDSAINQKEKLERCSFEVPIAWEKGENSTVDTLYFYPDYGMLMVMYLNVETSILNTIDREAFIDGVVSGFEECEMIGESEITVNDEPAYQFEMNARMADNDYSISLVTFDISSGLISFLMATLQSSDEDYSADFQKIINSISSIGTENAIDESVGDSNTQQDILNSEDDLATERIHSLKFGELLDVNYEGGVNGDTLVIKAKIEPSMTNKMTINQNYYNVEDIVLNQGGADYNSIQYWAVADMESGEEGKVISFTVNQELIEKIKNEEIVAQHLGDYVDDLWVLPTLTE